jgi:hypothetical protein
MMKPSYVQRQELVERSHEVLRVQPQLQIPRAPSPLGGKLPRHLWQADQAEHYRPVRVLCL